MMGPPPKEKSLAEKFKEDEEKRIMEEEKKKHDPPIMRLKSSTSKLDTDDLEDDERAVLKEVTRKGYYHARPQTDLSNMPTKIENPEQVEFKRVSFNRSSKPMRRVGLDPAPKLAAAPAPDATAAHAEPSRSAAKPAAARSTVQASREEPRRGAAVQVEEPEPLGFWVRCCKRRA